MKRLVCLGMLLAMAASCDAQAVRGIADIAIIDRATGTALTPYFYRGEYWVAGKTGARYALEIRNRIGGRLLAVTSVDGVNVLSGATAAWDQEGYVFDAGQQYQITGWRKSDTEIAAFTFTDSTDSYAGRTGRPGSVGVIGVALFREREPEPVSAPPTIGGSPLMREGFRAAPAPSIPLREEPRTASALPISPHGSAVQSAATAPMPTESAPAAAPLAKLGTGHGEREYSYVNHTHFQRQQNQPNQVISIHYDSLEHLVAMGIVRTRRTLPPNPDPFPGSPQTQYVPDPPGGD